jgi:hypothetical protein
LKKEELNSRKKLKAMMGMYHETIDKVSFLAKIFLPLHIHLRNLYRKNRSHQAQIRKLKE